MTEQKLEDIVPRHKHDMERVLALAGLERKQIESVLPQLLNWTADTNWPIASDVARYLFSLEPPPVELYSRLLAGDDGCAKWHFLSCLMTHKPRALVELLRKDIERLSYRPEPGDIHEEVNEIAQGVLDWMDGREGSWP